MKIISDNRKAYFDYEIEERIEAGISLNGAEFKSVKLGNVNLKDSFCHIYNGEMWLKNCFVSNYDKGSFYNEDERRDRRLLLHKREILKLLSKTKEKGYTIIPTKIYFAENGRVKVEIALARGKKLYDKRASIKEKDQTRNAEREIKHYTEKTRG